MRLKPRAGSSPALGTTFNVVAAFDAARTMKIFHKGTDPKLLILSGMHGDEADVVAHVSGFVSSHAQSFPDFVYLPTVSPSAIAQKTRQNYLGHDINRCFVDPIQDPEALQVCSRISKLYQVISLDFHEDSSHENDFYFYDTGEMSVHSLDIFRKHILQCDVSLYDGIDDSDDPNLGCHVIQGYVSHGHDKDSHESGFLTKWMAHKHIISRAFTFEIPGKSSQDTKNKLINAIFSFFIESKFMIQ